MAYFSKEKFADVNFVYGSKDFISTENDTEPSILNYVVVKTQEGKLGIMNVATRKIDYIDEYKPMLLVRKGKLWGYYLKTEIKYKKIGAFFYNLAEIELMDGRKGFIEKNGTEILKYPNFPF